MGPAGDHLRPGHARHHDGFEESDGIEESSATKNLRIDYVAQRHKPGTENTPLRARRGQTQTTSGPAPCAPFQHQWLEWRAHSGCTTISGDAL